MLTPVVSPHARMSKASEDRMARDFGARYAAGASVRALAEETGYSIARVRRLLALSGVTIRPRGATPRASEAIPGLFEDR